MNSKTMITRVAATHLLAAALLSAACSKDEGKPATESGAAKAAESKSQSENAALIAQIGVEPGPVEQKDGPAALLTKVSGQIELRRLGEETYSVAKQGDALFAGDQVRAAAGARAVVLFPDASAAELAEVSSLAIGSRDAVADPASSAAVLGGVARFSVSPRAPGEGPFIVFTPAGLVATKGTVFGVGVAASGDARVGVESGEVEVAGAVAFDAPLSLEASHAVELSAAGQLAAKTPWTEDDWGAWRDQAEAGLDVGATANLHADALAALTADLESTYGAVVSLGSEVASFEADVAAKASANDAAGYRAQLPAGALAIDASFLAALRLEWLTHAFAARALLAQELYVRHPEIAAWAKLEPRVHAAVLWPKRFDATAVAFFEPLRIQYYLHHPRGRAHAQLVGIAVPSFYASVTPPELALAELKPKLRFKAFTPPAVQASATARPVWIAAPSARWHAKVKADVAPPRGKVAFWVRPPQLKSKALLNAEIKAKVAPAFAVRPPQARGQLKAPAGFALGHKIKVAPPDLDAAAKARASWTLAGSAPAVEGSAKRELSAKLPAPHALDANAKLSAKAKLKAPEAKAKLSVKGKLDVPDAKATVAAKTRALGAATANAKANAKAEAKVGAQLKVKAPEVKPPQLKASGKASAKFKLGT
jgi:FecR protein